MCLVAKLSYDFCKVISVMAPVCCVFLSCRKRRTAAMWVSIWDGCVSASCPRAYHRVDLHKAIFFAYAFGTRDSALGRYCHISLANTRVKTTRVRSFNGRKESAMFRGIEGVVLHMSAHKVQVFFVATFSDREAFLWAYLTGVQKKSYFDVLFVCGVGMFQCDSDTWQTTPCKKHQKTQKICQKAP